MLKYCEIINVHGVPMFTVFYGHTEPLIYMSMVNICCNPSVETKDYTPNKMIFFLWTMNTNDFIVKDKPI